jgi:hypothetical protein
MLGKRCLTGFCKKKTKVYNVLNLDTNVTNKNI